MTNKFAMIKNSQATLEENIPVVDVELWRNCVIGECKDHGGRVVSMFGSRSNDGGVKLFGIIGHDAQGELKVIATNVRDGSFPSLTPELPEVHLFERELKEEFGITPTGHPWPKPVRERAGYNYYSVGGEEIHEVGVGPVHAGVIEPGHFRFQCYGENVFNLEIHLGYERRGVEALFIDASPARRMVLAESIAGDSAISHGLSYCHAVEGLAEKQVSQQARRIRAIALELERAANHIGDLGAIANDVGFQPLASHYGALKATFLNLLMEISGSRLGRSLLKPGGVAFDITPQMAEEFKKRLSAAKEAVKELEGILFSSPSVLSRFERTGVVTTEMAKKLGMVGVAARACNLSRDVRVNYPSGMYRFSNIIMARASSGDVYARVHVRAAEIKRSVEFIEELLRGLKEEKVYFPVETIARSSFVVSMIEGWRGEVVHIARTNEEGRLIQYKIVDPSFHNWSGLEFALRDGQISDFPLCNKSFNLSYAGYDL